MKSLKYVNLRNNQINPNFCLTINQRIKTIKLEWNVYEIQLKDERLELHYYRFFFLDLLFHFVLFFNCRQTKEGQTKLNYIPSINKKLSPFLFSISAGVQQEPRIQYIWCMRKEWPVPAWWDLHIHGWWAQMWMPELGVWRTVLRKR